MAKKRERLTEVAPKVSAVERRWRERRALELLAKKLSAMLVAGISNSSMRVRLRGADLSDIFKSLGIRIIVIDAIQQRWEKELDDDEKKMKYVSFYNDDTGKVVTVPIKKGGDPWDE